MCLKAQAGAFRFSFSHSEETEPPASPAACQGADTSCPELPGLSVSPRSCWEACQSGGSCCGDTGWVYFSSSRGGAGAQAGRKPCRSARQVPRPRRSCSETPDAGRPTSTLAPLASDCQLRLRMAVLNLSTLLRIVQEVSRRCDVAGPRLPQSSQSLVVYFVVYTEA